MLFRIDKDPDPVKIERILSPGDLGAAARAEAAGQNSAFLQGTQPSQAGSRLSRVSQGSSKQP